MINGLFVYDKSIRSHMETILRLITEELLTMATNICVCFSLAAINDMVVPILELLNAVVAGLLSEAYKFLRANDSFVDMWNMRHHVSVSKKD